MELIVTMIIVGILAVVVLPRFADRQSFETRGFADQTRAALGFARKVAVATGRNVCAVTTTSALTLTMASARGQAQACSPAVIDPASGAAYQINAPAGVAYVAPLLSPVFRGDGTADAGGVLTVRGDSDIALTVEATGHVH